METLKKVFNKYVVIFVVVFAIVYVGLNAFIKVENVQKPNAIITADNFVLTYQDKVENGKLYRWLLLYKDDNIIMIKSCEFNQVLLPIEKQVCNIGRVTI